MNIAIRRDEEVPGERLVAEIQNLGLAPRYNGWVTCQLVKIPSVLRSDSVASLVVDSDTVLQYPRVWVDGLGRQELSIGQECREVPFFTPTSFSALRVDYCFPLLPIISWDIIAPYSTGVKPPNPS